MIPIAVRWAFVGGVVGRIVPPITPWKTADAAIFAGIFATKTGQRLMWGTAVRTTSLVGSAALSVSTSTVVGVGLGAGAGAVIGAAAGTAISSAAFGPEGKQKAIEFYTGQANWYDYIPHYNAGKIVAHYAKEAIT